MENVRASDKRIGGYRRYWRAYGGFRELLRSGYLWSAVAFTLLLTPLWWRGDWWDIPLAVLPNLLGFTLGGYALLVSFGDEEFKAFLISTEVEESTAFMKVSATFIHFIVVQASALMAALVAKSCALFPKEWLVLASYDLRPGLPVYAVSFGWFVGFLLFVYSITLIAAAGMAVFEVTCWFNDYREVMAMPGDDVHPPPTPASPPSGPEPRAAPVERSQTLGA